MVRGGKIRYLAMNRKVKRLIKYFVPSLAAVILLWVCFKDVDWESFLSALKSCDWGFVVLAMAFGVLSFWLRGVRWRMLLLPVDHSTKIMTCFNSVNIGYVANMFFPRLGEVVRCGYITRSSAESGEGDGRRKASFDKVFGTVVTERTWDAVIVLVFFLCMLPFVWKRFGSFVEDNVLGNLIAQFNVVWIVLGVIVGVVLVVWLAWKLRGRGGFFAKVWQFIAGIGEGIATFTKMRHGWLFVLYTIAIWVCYWMTSVSVFWAVCGTDTAGLAPDMVAAIETFRGLDLIDVFILMFAGSVSSFVPVPGGFGAYHYVVCLTLTSVYGIPYELGIIFATISHEAQAVIQLLCGGFSYVYETFFVKDR